jgi:NAD(P)-dependent dehydrogenase (short-subunit alcohol dehydrogenase family)
MKWADKTWLVTGSSTGFGRAIVRAALARGANVVATARDPADLRTLAATQRGRLLTAELDVTQAEQIRRAVDAAVAAFGSIDVLVNNAGYGFQGGIEESTDDEIRQQFDVNFFGLAAVTRTVLPHMRRQRRGFVVNFSSVAGFMGFSGTGWYSASKFAVEGFSEALGQEAGALGIQVMIVEPGPFRTDFGGRSIRRSAQHISDYRSVLDRHQKTDAQNGRQSGDPDRAVACLIDAMESDEPPSRLLLGRMAIEAAERAYQVRSTEAAKWRQVALAADFPAE